MAATSPGTSPRLPEQYYYRGEESDLDFRVNELAADQAGSLSPFGDEMQFPLPVDQLLYEHPSKADRPHLADGH